MDDKVAGKTGTAQVIQRTQKNTDMESLKIMDGSRHTIYR